MLHKFPMHCLYWSNESFARSLIKPINYSTTTGAGAKKINITRGLISNIFVLWRINRTLLLFLSSIYICAQEITWNMRRDGATPSTRCLCPWRPQAPATLDMGGGCVQPPIMNTHILVMISMHIWYAVETKGSDAKYVTPSRLLRTVSSSVKSSFERWKKQPHFPLTLSPDRVVSSLPFSFPPWQLHRQM